MALSQPDTIALENAFRALENPGLATRLTDMVGKPIELLGNSLPASASEVIHASVSKALGMALQAALLTLQHKPHAGSQIFHKALAAASGAAGGVFGLSTLPIELPISTIIMLRSIADIARGEGEDLTDPDTTLSCLEVFALGGRSQSDDASESGYFALRSLLAQQVTEAARYLATHAIVEESAPALVRFLTQVAARFGFVVTEKVIAQSVPILGALGGAAVNYLFIEHFQSIALGHFTIRRLERSYGKSIIREQYDRIKANRHTE